MAKQRPTFNVGPENFNETRVPHGGLNTQVPAEPVKAPKNFHMHILTHAPLVARMDAVAKRQGLSRAQLFEKVMREYLDTQDI